jgi:hypothetical protein
MPLVPTGLTALSFTKGLAALSALSALRAVSVFIVQVERLVEPDGERDGDVRGLAGALDGDPAHFF